MFHKVCAVCGCPNALDRWTDLTVLSSGYRLSADVDADDGQKRGGCGEVDLTCLLFLKGSTARCGLSYVSELCVAVVAQMVVLFL